MNTWPHSPYTHISLLIIKLMLIVLATHTANDAFRVRLAQSCVPRRPKLGLARIRAVKLKWLAPSASEQRNNRSTVVGNGHQLEIVRVGQTVAFECNAAAQPRPRIRWYRLAAHLSSASSSIGAAGKYRGAVHNSDDANKWPALHQQTIRPPDEAQIRSSLLQVDNYQQTGANSDSFARLEIGELSSFAALRRRLAGHGHQGECQCEEEECV